MDGDGSEVDVTVEALVDNVDDGSEPEVVAESKQPSERSEGSQADEIPNVNEVADHEVDATSSVSDNEVKPELPVGVDEISRSEVEEVGQISESEDPVNEINESETPPVKPEPRAKHPELDPVKDPVEDVAEVSEPTEAEVEPVEPVDPVVDPIEEDPLDPVDPVDEPEEGGYTSASHSYHPGSDSEDEEALQAELAQKEDEHNKLASQVQLMQQEMEALRKILEQNQQELAMSSQETQH